MTSLKDDVRTVGGNRRPDAVLLTSCPHEESLAPLFTRVDAYFDPAHVAEDDDDFSAVVLSPVAIDYLLSRTSAEYLQSVRGPEQGVAHYAVPRALTESELLLKDLADIRQFVSTAGGHIPPLDSLSNDERALERQRLAEMANFWARVRDATEWLEDVFNNRLPELDWYPSEQCTNLRVNALVVWCRSLVHPRRRLPIIGPVFARMLRELTVRARERGYLTGQFEVVLNEVIGEALGDNAFILLLPHGKELTGKRLINALLRELENDIAERKRRLPPSEPQSDGILDPETVAGSDNIHNPRKRPLPFSRFQDFNRRFDPDEYLGRVLARHGCFSASVENMMAEVDDLRWILGALYRHTTQSEHEAIDELTTKSDDGTTLSNRAHQSLFRLRHRYLTTSLDGVDDEVRQLIVELAERLLDFRTRRRNALGAAPSVGMEPVAPVVQLRTETPCNLTAASGN